VGGSTGLLSRSIPGSRSLTRRYRGPMDGEKELMIDEQAHDLLAMLACDRGQTVEKTLADLIEAEVERVEPGMLADLRRPGAAIKRFYAAIGKPVPRSLTEAEQQDGHGTSPAAEAPAEPTYRGVAPVDPPTSSSDRPSI
jgi:hypothetical protein